METSTELDFRDGRRVVPEHLAALMGGFDTTQYTYQQALDQVNSGMLNERLAQAQQKHIQGHFEKVRSDGSG